MKGEFGKKVEDVDMRTGIGFSRVEMRLSSVSHPDFNDKLPKIIEISKANPEWTSERCYQQVVDDEKKATDLKVSQEKEQKEKEKQAFAEKGVLPPEILQSKGLKGRAAVEKAYELVVEGGKTTEGE